MRKQCFAAALTVLVTLGSLPVALADPPKATVSEVLTYPASTHWAAAAARSLAQRLAEQPLPGLAPWFPPADLDAPVTAEQWNDLLARIFGVQPGPEPATGDRYRYWVYTYTVGLADLPAGGISRQNAIGGMVKLLSVDDSVNHDKFSREVLQRFPDQGEIADYQTSLLAAAVQLGLVSGTPTGALEPLSPLTWGQAVTLSDRLIGLRGVGPSKEVGLPWAGSAPAPAGFAKGLKPQFTPDGLLNPGSGTGGMGDVAVTVHGTASAASLPRVGPAPAGHHWLVLDLEVINRGTSRLVLTRQLRLSLEDPLQVLYQQPVDVGASLALASPFADGQAVLPTGHTVRGLVAFAVPIGTKGVWYRIDGALAKPKDATFPWTSTLRGAIGDLPGPERVYPFGAGTHDGRARVAGRYATLAEAAAVAEKARAMGIPGWVNGDPDGGYAAVAGFLFFEN